MPAAQAKLLGEGAHQAFTESQQGRRIELLTGLAEGRGAYPLGERLAGERLPEAVQLILECALA